MRDNFFELGGDSIRAARVTEQVRGAFGIDADVYELFENPSIEQMAVAIAAADPPPEVREPRADRGRRHRRLGRGPDDLPSGP